MRWQKPPLGVSDVIRHSVLFLPTKQSLLVHTDLLQLSGALRQRARLMYGEIYIHIPQVGQVGKPVLLGAVSRLLCVLMIVAKLHSSSSDSFPSGIIFFFSKYVEL